MIDVSTGGVIEGRLFLKRNGIEYAEMGIDSDAPISLSMTFDAEIKIAIKCKVSYVGKINYFEDTLIPYLLFNGEKVRLGEYVIVESIKDASDGSTVYELNGFDLTQRAKGSRIEEPVYFAAGTRYTDAISQLLTASGIINYIVTPSIYSMATDREDWDLGTDRLTIINDLLLEINYNTLFMRMDGVVYAEPYKEPTPENVSITYYNDPQTSILLPGGTIDIDAFDHYNVFHYTCENPELDAFWTAVAENNVSTNKFSIPNQGRVPVFRTVNNAASQAALQAMADRERLESMYSADTITFETGLNPYHGVFDIVYLHKDGFSGIVMEIGWDMEISPGGIMTHTAKRWALE